MPSSPPIPPIPPIEVSNPEALIFEERLIASTYDVNLWLQYIDSVDDAVEELEGRRDGKKVGEMLKAEIEKKVRRLRLTNILSGLECS